MHRLTRLISEVCLDQLHVSFAWYGKSVIPSQYFSVYPTRSVLTTVHGTLTDDIKV